MMMNYTDKEILNLLRYASKLDTDGRFAEADELMRIANTPPAAPTTTPDASLNTSQVQQTPGTPGYNGVADQPGVTTTGPMISGPNTFNGQQSTFAETWYMKNRIDPTQFAQKWLKWGQSNGGWNTAVPQAMQNKGIPAYVIADVVARLSKTGQPLQYQYQNTAGNPVPNPYGNSAAPQQPQASLSRVVTQRFGQAACMECGHDGRIRPVNKYTLELKGHLSNETLCTRCVNKSKKDGYKVVANQGPVAQPSETDLQARKQLQKIYYQNRDIYPPIEELDKQEPLHYPDGRPNDMAARERILELPEY